MSKKGPDRLAITRNGRDLLRVIPGSMDDGKLDIKIDCLGIDYTVFCYPLMARNPIFDYSPHRDDTAITYHHGKDDLPVVIHLKRKHPSEHECRYRNLPLNGIIAPTTDLIMPLPLLKLEIGEDACFKFVKAPKRGVKSLPIDPGNNVCELYMTSRDFTFHEMSQVFPGLASILANLPFECWSSSWTTVNQSKAETVPHGNPVELIKGVEVGPVCFFIVQYRSSMLFDVDSLRLSFIDNALSETIMLFSQRALDKQLRFELCKAPGIQDVEMHSSLRVNNKRYQSLWLTLLREFPGCDLVQTNYRRIENQRVSLLKALKQRDFETDRRIDSLKSQYLAWSKEPKADANHNLGALHLSFASFLGLQVVLMHNCGIYNSDNELVLNYAFMTIGDIDIHLGYKKLQDLLGTDIEGPFVVTEGIPFADGLMSARGAILRRGYLCSRVLTRLLFNIAEGEDAWKAEAIDLCLPYAVETSSELESRYKSTLDFYQLTEEELESNRRRHGGHSSCNEDG